MGEIEGSYTLRAARGWDEAAMRVHPEAMGQGIHSRYGQ